MYSVLDAIFLNLYTCLKTIFVNGFCLKLVLFFFSDDGWYQKEYFVNVCVQWQETLHMTRRNMTSEVGKEKVSENILKWSVESLVVDVKNLNKCLLNWDTAFSNSFVNIPCRTGVVLCDHIPVRKAPEDVIRLFFLFIKLAQEVVGTIWLDSGTRFKRATHEDEVLNIMWNLW